MSGTSDTRTSRGRGRSNEDKGSGLNYFILLSFFLEKTKIKISLFLNYPLHISRFRMEKYRAIV